MRCRCGCREACGSMPAMTGVGRAVMRWEVGLNTIRNITFGIVLTFITNGINLY